MNPKKMNGWKAILILTVLTMFSVITATAYAKTSTSTLEYKGTKATAKLETDFGWKIFGTKDKATATTSFTTSNNGYRVAVRLERWSDKNTMADFKYNKDSQIAQCNYTWTDVYAYMSRHSIDNSTNTVEYAVDSFNHKD